MHMLLLLHSEGTTFLCGKSQGPGLLEKRLHRGAWRVGQACNWLYHHSALSLLTGTLAVLQYLVDMAPCVAQVTVRLVGADEQTAMYLSPAQFSWLPSTGVAAVRSYPVVLGRSENPPTIYSPTTPAQQDKSIFDWSAVLCAPSAT